MKQHEEVRGALESALAATCGVSGAAYFGSTATDGADRLSDIDLLVRCEAAAAGQFLRRLHAVLGIVLFRPFSEDRKPGGRYWFAGSNPFVRLDVSFYDASEFDQLLLHGGGFTQPPFRPIQLRKTPSDGSADRDLPGWSRLDHDFAGALRRFHESAKRLARHTEPERPLDEVDAALRAYRDEPLRPEIWNLYEETLHVLRPGPVASRTAGRRRAARGP